MVRKPTISSPTTIRKQLCDSVADNLRSQLSSNGICLQGGFADHSGYGLNDFNRWTLFGDEEI
jgi:hypothetical protein